MPSISCFAVSVLVSAGALAQGQAPATGSGPGTGRAAPSGAPSPGGVAVDFSERKLGEADRTPEGELKAMLASTATLKLGRAIRYRATVLGPGSYPVAVTGDDRSGGRSLFFVIGPAAGPSGEKVSPEEKKQEETSGSKADRGAAGVQDKKGAEERRPSGAKTPPGMIKALFHLTPATKPSAAVEFTVRPNRRGDRFTLTVRAGASQGKTSLRFVES